MKTIFTAKVESWAKVGEPETLASSRECRFLSQCFRSPDGQEHDYSLLSWQNGSIVCPITSEGNLVLVRQYKQGINDITLEFPAGATEKNEDPIDTATRELLEETGYASDTIHCLYRHPICSRKSPTCFHVFIALHCKLVGSQQLDEAETIEVLEATPQEFWRLVRTGVITDPITLTAAIHALLAGHLPDDQHIARLCNASFV